MEEDENRYPQFQSFMIPRQRYLNIISQNSDVMSFYTLCERYSSNRMVHDPESGFISMSGELSTLHPKELKANPLVTKMIQRTNGEGWDFLALWPSNEADIKTSLKPLYQPISAVWDQDGLTFVLVLLDAEVHNTPTFETIKSYKIKKMKNDFSHPPYFKPLSELRIDVFQTVFLAYSLGYFDINRRTTLRAIAAERGLSHMTISRHLREFQHLAFKQFF